MGYRTSRVLREGLIVTEVCLELTPDDPQAVRARTDDYTARAPGQATAEHAQRGFDV